VFRLLFYFYLFRNKLIKKGTNLFVAPEILENKEFDVQIDLFSLGVCLFMMVFKRSPYEYVHRNDKDETYAYKLDISELQKMKREKKKDPGSIQLLSATGIDFMMNLLSVDPIKRPTASQAMNHAWFINFTSK
jgi:serine/threonine protein kinase